MSRPPTLLPGRTIGLLGGGQLGRMFAIAARRLGYRVHILSPETDSPAGQLADLEVSASYADEQVLREFGAGIDVLTYEFENIPSSSVSWASENCPARPSGDVLHICQHRLREKQFLSAAGLPLPKFAAIESEADLRRALHDIGYPAVLKTASFGYDGKGQKKLVSPDEISGAWASFAGQPGVLEAWAPFEKEVSVIVARGLDGETVTFPVFENVHARHILDVTFAPALLDDATTQRACRLAESVAAALDLVGLLAVEMFVLADGSILINELAPRPHNSGHLTFDACVTSQFEQQLRAVCGLPLGSTDLLRPAAMANLLGDLWADGEPDWAAALALPDVKLHLYGKAEARPGRKMGHLVAFGETTAEAVEKVRAARERLTPKRGV